MKPFTLEQRRDGWYVASHVQGYDDAGPYRTRAEADDLRRGAERMLRHEHDRKFWGNERSGHPSGRSVEGAG